MQRPSSSKDTHCVLLLSDWDRQKLYPWNRQSRFVTKLNEPWDCSGDWDAAVMSISFPRSWRNYHEERRITILSYVIATDFFDDNLVTIPAGYYSSPKEVVEYMVNRINQTFIKVKSVTASLAFDYDERTMLTSLRAKGVMIIIQEEQWHKQFMPTLGFKALTEADVNGLPVRNVLAELPKEVREKAEKLIEREFTPTKYNRLNQIILWPDHAVTSNDPAGDMSIYNHMLIYSDICQDINIGGTRGPCIGLAPLYGDTHLAQKMFHFDNPIWLPLKKEKIDTIEIFLGDDDGNEIKFHSGRVVCMLVARRRGILL